MQVGKEGRAHLFRHVVADGGKAMYLGRGKKRTPPPQAGFGSKGGVGQAPAEEARPALKAVPVRPEGPQPRRFPVESAGKGPAGMAPLMRIQSGGIEAEPRGIERAGRSCSEGHREVRKCIQALNGLVAEGSVREAAGILEERPVVQGPRPRVQEDQATNRFRMPKSIGEADRSPPVVNDEREVREFETLEQRLNESGVGRGAVGERGRGLGSAKSEIIGGDTAVIRGEALNQMAVEVGTRRISVEKHHGGPVAHIRVGQRSRGSAEDIRNL